MKNIFSVEDDANNRDFFIEVLGNIQNATLYGIANNGKEAFDKLTNSDFIPDIIFMDVNMPLMNGIECLCAIKRFPRTEHIPVIMLSTSVGHAQLWKELGAKGYIKKPSDLTLLQTELNRVI